MGENVLVSYETYKSIFNSEFNVSFGYPRTGTSSICDEFLHKISDIDRKLKDNNKDVEQFFKNCHWRTLYIKKAETFDQSKRETR